jgi:hypothetical protein
MRLPTRLSELQLPAAQPAFSSGLAALLIAGSTLNPLPSYAATDNAAIGKCVVSQCTAPLARCVTTSPSCLANLLCIQTCTDRADESECQIKCGDKFTDAAVEAFTKCAVMDKQVPALASAAAPVADSAATTRSGHPAPSRAQCVPQRQDDGAWPVPKQEALVDKFKPEVTRASRTLTSAAVASCAAAAGRQPHPLPWVGTTRAAATVDPRELGSRGGRC